MKVSNDLLFFDEEKGSLIYNYEMDSVCLVNREMSNLLKQNDINAVLAVSDDQTLNMLRENGILVHQNNLTKKKNNPSNIIEKNSIRYIHLHITQRCNLRCEYCYNAHNLGRIDELTFEEIKNLAIFLKSSGVEHIVLTGGEPLLRQDIVDIAKQLKELNFKLGLLSNGTLLGGKTEILEWIDYAIISMDTLDENDNLRKGLDVQLLCNTLKNISLSLRHKIILRSVIGKRNQTSWRKVKQFAQENRMGYTSTMCLPNNIDEVTNMPNLEMIEIVPDSMVIYGEKCGAGMSRIAIDSNGDIYPCQSLMKKEFLMGNIKKTTWLEEVEKSNIKKLFETWSIDETEHCKNCKMKYLCGGGCRAIAYNVYGSINAFNECMCDYLKLQLNERMKAIIRKCLP